MVISLDSYRTQKAAAQTWLKNGTYGAEIMHTDWNAPVVHVLREAVPDTSEVAKALGLNRRDLYRRALALKDGG